MKEYLITILIFIGAYWGAAMLLIGWYVITGVMLGRLRLADLLPPSPSEDEDHI